LITLATHTLEVFIAAIFADYLTATHDGYLDELITKETMDGIKEPVRPAIVITAKEDDNKQSGRRVITVNPVLLTWAKSEEAGTADNENQTTRADASKILADIESRLMDHAAWNAWLLTIDEERLAGWTILKIIHGGLASPMRPDPATRSVFYALDLKLHLSVSRRSV